MSHSPVRYVSFPLSAFPKSSPLALEGIPPSSGGEGGEERTKERREGGKYGLTNSECKSWLIVVDTVALRNFSTTTIAQKLRDGMERRREISRNVWKVPPLLSLRKLLATIASLNEILINYSTGNRAGMSNCLIRSRDSFGGKVKIRSKKKEKKRDLSPFLARAVFPRFEIREEERERRLIVRWCYEQ